MGLDPLTASLNLLTRIVEMTGKVWDATPDELKRQQAGDVSQFIHNIGKFALDVQDRIDKLIEKK